jgi:glycosyltransferase involved in cell wall biosynthesis
VKVLLVSQPASDGVFRHVEGLADYLIAQGLTVHLAYSDRDACDQLPAFVARVAAAGGRTLNLQVGNGPSPADLPALWALLSLIRDTTPDIIHAHSSKAGGLVRGLAFLGLRRRLFYTPNGYFRMHAPNGFKARVFHAIERVLGRRGTTINVSRDEATFAREQLRIPEASCQIVANGVDCERFRPAALEEKRELRARFGVPPEALVLGTVGRFSAQKDPLTTYLALATVLPSIPNLQFVHLGKGELEPAVDALLAEHGLTDRCRRIPYLADTAPFYRMLDGFVLASRYEGMSFAAIESLASGLPLILSRAPGNQDFAHYGLDQVYWTPPDDPEALAEAIQAWSRRTNTESTTPNHRAIAVKQLSVETGYARLLKAYRTSD